MTRHLFLFAFVIGAFAHCNTMAQETVFTILKKDSQTANDYFKERNYQAALGIYTKLHGKDPLSKTWTLKMGQCAYLLKEYSKAVASYSQLPITELAFDDLYYLAESFASMDNYKRAIDCYQKCLEKSPDNSLITQKIWRLNNIKYLYEDSLHYAVRSLAINSENSELGIVPFKQGVVFVSNRKQVHVVEKIDATMQQPFYAAYYAAAYVDSSGNTLPRYRKPILFNKTLFTGLHAGPMTFYARGNKMVFVSSSESVSSHGERTLQLFFAEQLNGHWKRLGGFQYNSTEYSITDPCINENGSTLYFTSNMPGGFGGKDIYRSYFLEGQWSKPENLGESVNTVYDEIAPYLHLGKTLYFSSSGHPGMGGLDIFKMYIDNGNFGEVENMGYPVNSTFDEFGITTDSLSTHGYFSSNRKNGGYDDDLYEFDMDLQTYPLALSGIMHFKESGWSDTTELKPFAHARYYLIDNLRDIVVQEGVSDEQGHFSWTIPYFSKYRVRVIGPDNDEHIVSLEIPKHRREQSNHEIVVVKDAFR